MNYNRFKVALLCGPWLEFLSEIFTEALQNRRAQLSRKARPENVTQVYWVEPLNSSNFDYAHQQLREKFLQCLEANYKSFENMRVLKLRDFWNKLLNC